MPTPRTPDAILSLPRLLALTALAMLAFAGNSLLCRAALMDASIDPASFTTLRLGSGALMLGILGLRRKHGPGVGGSWISALALFVYAAGFSMSYVSLSAATGALLLFGAVQITMIVAGLAMGERLRAAQVAGLLLATGGLLGLLLPGLSRPPLIGALWMIAAGTAWGVYSLRGRGGGDPIWTTAGNFLRAVPFAVALSLVQHDAIRVAPDGIAYATASGALASACGYAIWYTVLPWLKAAQAATVQLSVPVLAGVAGVLLLGESLSLRLGLTAMAILGGIALVLVARRQ
ncbi:DMT family transporter [Dokdonella sp.]|uniref:DMT family transporter n=1 Tax=Dokdonella sp. TaxID=2291710 RepID=UPI003527C12F